MNYRILYPVFLYLFLLFFVPPAKCNEADSAYVFSYATDKNHHHNGLHYAWSIDNQNWHAIGPETRFLFCDFGRWGAEKRMKTPFMFLDKKGVFHCIWTLNETVGQFAHAATADMYNWKPQSYPRVMEKGNVLMPEVSYQKKIDGYLITWLSEIDGKTGIYKTTTKDFKNYGPVQKASEKDRFDVRKEVVINGETQSGVIHKVSWAMVDGLIKYQQWMNYHNEQRAENMGGDPDRFKSLKPVDAEITLTPENSKQISDMLIGVFFEDINYAADGGIYAELVQNRGFEYDPGDREGRDTTWNSFKAWHLNGGNAVFSIDTVDPVHENNKHYAVLETMEVGAGLVNEGFDGIPLKAGEDYKFSVFAKVVSGPKSDLLISLKDENGKVYGKASVSANSGEWKKYETIITAGEHTAHASIEIAPQLTGKVALDMVSLFPEKTFMGRENGLRADIAQTIADMGPKFVRFPGGCVAHGDGLGNMYRWKNTVGPLEARKPQRNIWGYHQTAGLGYYEYFQYCEDIGAEPLPVLPAGVPCQNSATGGHGQHGGIPMRDMGDYVQEVLDLVEWANGDKNTTWGKVRAGAGHPEPFNLKYIGIGNEDLITDIFAERFTMIFNALKEKHPEITVIGTVGPFYMGSDYEAGWELATKLGVPMVDEHYYQPPGWFLNNQDFYDRYDRDKSKVYLGEYAAHVRGRKMNIETALSEALYLTCIERNGDVVSMTSFAPLLAKEHHTQWNPDLIYFNNTGVKPTVDYYVQQLFGQHSGDEYIPGFIKLSNNHGDVTKRVAFSVVKDHKTNDLIIKLVNLLPVEVNSTIDLGAFVTKNVSADLAVLSGAPEDRDAKPVKSQMEVSVNSAYKMPAYSFSVIRINLDD